VYSPEFRVTILKTLPCDVVSFAQNRLAIKVPNDFYKYVYGSSPKLTLPFKFDLDAPGCHFYKTYHISVVNKVTSAVVASSPWIKIIETQTTPSLEVTDDAVKHTEGWYIVTITSKLWATSPAPSFAFHIYTHPNQCLKSTISGQASISDISYEIAAGATATQNYFTEF